MGELIGREAELARGRAALDRVFAAKGALVLFSGEAGIGKTSLADAIAEDAARRGATVAWGRCWEAGGAPAYWPWTQAFRALGLPDPFATEAPTAASEAREVRFHVFDRAAEALRAHAMERPTLIVLDDLHAADVPSLLFLALTAKNLRLGGKIGIVGTYRDAEARLAGEIGALLAKIARDGELVAPARLSPGDVAAWVRAERPDASPEAIARVHAVSEGNPLFVAELLRVRTTLDATNLPDGLRATLEEHLARVPAETRALLAVASVLGREWDPADACALADLSADDVAARIAEARAAGLVTSLGEARQSFAHMLIRDVLHSGLAPSRRAALHEAAGERCVLAGDLAGAAHHLFEAGARERAAEVALGAVRAALARHAFEDARALAVRALEVAAAESELACELTLMSAEALIRMGASTEGKQAALRAAELAARIHAPALLARAALAHGAEIGTGMVDPVQVDVLRRAGAALEGTGDTALLARVTARLASALVPPSTREEWTEAQEIAGRALAMANGLDDDTRLFVLRFVASAKGYGVPTAERYALVREIVELATRLDRRLVLIDVLGFWASVLREAGDVDEMRRVLDRWVELVSEHPRPHYLWRVPMVLGIHALLDGDHERADRLVEEGARLAWECDTPGGRVAWTLNRISAAFLRDDWASLAKERDRVAPILERIKGTFTAVEAILAYLADGDRETAVAILRSVPPPAAGELELPRITMLGMSAATLGDPEVAERLAEHVATHRGESPIFWGAHGSAMFGPTSLFAARLAALAGHTERARELYAETLAIVTRLRSPLLVARVEQETAALGRASAPPSRAAPSRIAIAVTRDGDVWRVTSTSGAAVTLKDGKGLAYLAELVRAEGRELHVTQLAGVDEVGDAGPVLDAKAKAAYQARLEDLRDRLEEARRNHDPVAAERAEAEIDALADQLAGAVGLGGRDRKAGSHVERARINVQRRLRDVLRRVAEQDPHLGRYLEASIKTGTWCSFRPV